MPIVKTVKINEKSAYAVWEITETVEGLAEKIKDTVNTQLPDDDISNPTKQKEWMAGRLAMSALINEMGHAYPGIYKDAYGKPHLKSSEFQISLSHSFPLVAVIINKEHSVGIDIEQPKNKLKIIASKFLSENELKVCGDDINLLCTHWCAKEALYKLYGKKKLIFKENLFINLEHGNVSGKVIVKGTTNEYDLVVEKYANSLLVFTL